MPTNITLDDDIVERVEAFRRDRGLGLAAAVNELIRRGLAVHPHETRPPFRQTASSMGPPLVSLDAIGRLVGSLDTEPVDDIDAALYDQ